MDKLPIPTDNIYKFYALFGLLLFIFSAGALVAVQRSTNDFMYRSLVDLETLKAIGQPTSADTVKKQVLERLIEVSKEDKKVFNNALSFAAAFGTLLAGFGFIRWHMKVQPLQDEMIELQLQKLRHEVAAMPTAKPPPPLAGAGAGQPAPPASPSPANKQS